MLRLILSLFFLTKLQCENMERELYKNFQIVEIECSEECNVDFTKKFNSRSDEQQFEILHRRKFKYQALVGPEIANDFYSSIENQNSSYSILIPDVSQHISTPTPYRSEFNNAPRKRRRRRRQTSSGVGGISFFRYMSMDEIYAYTTKIANDYPEFVKKSVIGKSHYDENITMVTISKRSNQPIIFIEAGMAGFCSDCRICKGEVYKGVSCAKCTDYFHLKCVDLPGQVPKSFSNPGIHAREWVGISTALYMIDQLINNSDLATKFEWRIVPVANPDGYLLAYLWSWKRRFWRKNMRYHDGYCMGVDLNRNFGVGWGREEENLNQCSPLYPGAEPFSEPETKAIRNAVLDAKVRIKAYISVHSYGQMIMTPPGNGEIPINQETAALLKSTAMKLSRAIQEKTNATYEYGTFEELLPYPTFGGAADWTFLNCGITHSYAFEMRDRGEFGFLLPKDQIIGTGEDFYEAMRELATIVRSNLSENADKNVTSIPVNVQNATGVFQENAQRNNTENVHLRDDSALSKNMKPNSSNSNSN